MCSCGGLQFVGGRLGLPEAILAEQGVERADELAHDGDEGDLGRLAAGEESLVEGLGRGFATDRGQGRHVEQGPGRGRQKPVEPGRRSDPQPAIAGPLAELRPLRLELARGAEAVAEWNECVQRYHPLGYRQPIGAHLRYFLLDRQGRQLGCLLFDFAARQLACRDARIGWEGETRRKPLERVVRNTRYLLFPWVCVKNLASHALGLALRQLAQDWQRVGRTQGSPAKGGRPAKPPKDVWLYPLGPDWREVLLGRPSAARPRRLAALVAETSARGEEERFTRMWQEILSEAVRLASEHDRAWMRRRRVLHTLLVVLFVFRLVFAPDRQGYAVTLAELWAQCRRLGLELPQPTPVSAASMCAARAKVRADVFLRIHRAILARAPRDEPRLRRRRLEAEPAPPAGRRRLPPACAGGPLPPRPAQLPLPATRPPARRLRPARPGDERRAALAHLPALAPGDVVVYDRGYYSFRLLHAHAERGLHAVFRLQSNANAAFAAFFRSDRRDDIVTVEPSDEARRQSPPGGLAPCRVRLVKYAAGTSTYVLATTLLDRQRYRVRDLSDLYHARWGIEEMYKVSKQMLSVEQFHGQSELLVQQELSAHFSLLAMTRLFPNHSEGATAPLRASRRCRPISATACAPSGGTSKGCSCTTRPRSRRRSGGSSTASLPAASGGAPTVPTRASRASRPANGGPASPPRPRRQPEDPELRREPPKFPCLLN